MAFEAATRWRPIILQHLLLGMNAHINLDLGIAAATVAPREALPSFQHDFDEINVILTGLIGAVEAEMQRDFYPVASLRPCTTDRLPTPV